MIDSELLKFAAKAAGIEPVYCYESRRNCLRIGDKKSYSIWSPLTDDGDALRLAVKLYLQVSTASVSAWRNGNEVAYVFEDYPNPYEATRRAIVRVAAEIGRAMP